MKHGTEPISSATLLYHLGKLEEDGLIKSDKIDGKRIFFPRNLRTKELERAYMLLKNENALKIFHYILDHDIEIRIMDIDTGYWTREAVNFGAEAPAICLFESYVGNWGDMGNSS